MPQISEEALAELSKQLDYNSLEKQKMATQYAISTYRDYDKPNLVEYQLDFSKELVELERLLRNDLLVRDENGQQQWIANPNKERITLNELGVNDVLRLINSFLTKNKILSNYGLEEIKPRIKMITDEVRVLIYNNAEAYEIDNEYKENNYSSIVLAICSMLEDAYRRALNGETAKTLNQTTLVTQTQSDGINRGSQYPLSVNINQPKQKSLLNPFTWFS